MVTPAWSRRLVGGLALSGVVWAVFGVVPAAVAAPVPDPVPVPAPGTATAVGFVGDLTGDTSAGTHVILDNRLGEVSGPPAHTTVLTGAQTQVQLDLGPGIGQVTVFQAARIETSAAATRTTQSSSAKVTGAEISTPMGILAIDSLSTQVSCQRGDTPTASFGPTPTVTLNGNPVAVDPTHPTVVDYDSSTDPTGPPGTATITLSLSPHKVRTADSVATAFVFALEEDLTGIVVASGTISLAQAACASPPAPGSTQVTATPSGAVDTGYVGSAPRSSHGPGGWLNGSVLGIFLSGGVVLVAVRRRRRV